MFAPGVITICSSSMDASSRPDCNHTCATPARKILYPQGRYTRRRLAGGARAPSRLRHISLQRRSVIRNRLRNVKPRDGWRKQGRAKLRLIRAFAGDWVGRRTPGGWPSGSFAGRMIRCFRIRRATSTAIFRCPTGDSSVLRPPRWLLPSVPLASRTPASSGNGPALRPRRRPRREAQVRTRATMRRRMTVKGSI